MYIFYFGYETFRDIEKIKNAKKCLPSPQGSILMNWKCEIMFADALVEPKYRDKNDKYRFRVNNALRLEKGWSSIGSSQKLSIK